MTQTELKSRLNKALEFLQSELVSIRAGRANTSILENLSVSAYGAMMTMKELGSITVLDSQNLVISPWDKGLVQSIVKAIRESDLNLNPTDDGNVVRVPIPALTEERRVELTKLAAKKAEDTKQTIRGIRQDAMKEIDKDFTDKKLGEDEKFTLKEEVEDTVKEFANKIDDLLEAKKKDLMTI